MINPDLAYEAWLDIWNRDENRFLTKEIDAVSEATRNLPGIKQTLDQYDRYQKWHQKGQTKLREKFEQKGGFHAFLNRVKEGTNLAYQGLGMPIEVVSRALDTDPRAIGAAATAVAVGKNIKFPTTISKLPVQKTIKGKSRYTNGKVVDTTAYSPTPTSGNLASKEAALKTRISQFQAGGSKSTRDLNLTTSSAKTATNKLSKKQVAANAAAETEIALTRDATGKIQRSVPPELDHLSKLPEAEQVRRITRAIELQHESQQLGKKSELLTSAQSLGTGQKVFMESPEVKLAAGLKLEAPGILKKFGHAWNSAVQQAHHWFQKGFTGPFMQHMVKLARDPNSPITFYDVANIEAAIQSTGIPGIGHSGVGGIIESIHNYSHDLDRKLGREPTGGKLLATSEMTPKQLKDEAAKQRKINKHLKDTGEDLEKFYPGPSLGNLLEEAFKLKTAAELTQYVIDIANEFYVPQMKRMQKLNEAAEDDLPEFSANVELSRLRRDDTKAIIRGAKSNTLGLTKEQLKARKDKESFEYQEARVAQRESAIEIDKRRDAIKEQKADIAQENLMRGYEPGTPEYEYLEWIHDHELTHTRWRTGGRIQSFGRVR